MGNYRIRDPGGVLRRFAFGWRDRSGERVVERGSEHDSHIAGYKGSVRHIVTGQQPAMPSLPAGAAA